MRMSFVLIALLSFCPPVYSEGEAPNILLIVADDMGYGDLSSYGSLQIATPNLDRLANGGVRCSAGYVTSSVCAPSRAGFLTGRSGSRFGFEHNLSRPSHIKDEFAAIPLDEPLLSERLQELGYRTGLVGKWHLGESVPGHHPLERGFDSFFGMLGGSHPYWPTLEKNRLLFGHDKPTSIRTPYLTDWFTLEAIDFIRRDAVESAGDESKPWFLYLSYNTPHGPMQARPEDLEKYAHIKNEKRRAYCAMQHCMDENIGRILDELEARGELDNTLIAFISDNGGSVEVSHAVNAPLWGTKGTFFEGGIRVPTIYHWPAQLKPGTYDRPVSSVDFMATFVAAAGGVAPEAGVRQSREGRKPKKGPIFDSVNLLPYLNRDKPGDPHAALYWRMALRGSAIRAGDWKLLRPNSQSAQLFDLSVDVGEAHNLAAEHPEIVERLMRQLNTWEESLERNPLFLSDPYWLGYNRRLYAKEFSRTQPMPDDSSDIWGF